MDLTQGQLVLLTEFDTLIRPGDECEFGYVGDDRWWKGTYRGCLLDRYMFQSDIEIIKDGFGMYSAIRPLPAPVVEVTPELEQARLRIENAERELSEARAALERASK